MIYPSQIEMFLRRQGWRNFSEAEDEINAIEDEFIREAVRAFPAFHWTNPDSDLRWIVCTTTITDPNLRQRYQESIDRLDRLSHIYCCQPWELECVLRCEPIAGTHNEIIEIFDQMTALEPIESPDHQPVKIRCNKDGADKLIAALISHRYGWGSTVSAVGRGGGVFDLTIENVSN